MKKIVLLAIVLCVTVSCAQDLNIKVKGNREPTTQITEVPPFKVLQIDSDYEVAIVKGARTQVELTTDSNLHQFITINHVGDKLVIGSNAKIRSKREMKFRITFGPELNSIIVTEDAQLSGVTNLLFTNLDLNIDGDARVYLTAQVDNLKLTATGDSKSELNLTGKTATINFTDNANVEALITYDNVEMLLKDRVDTRLEGDVDSGEITLQDRIELRADNLIFDTLELIVSHNAKAEVNVKDYLKIEADKDADITVHNSAKIELTKFEDNSILRKK